MALRENQEIFGRRPKSRVGIWALLVMVAAVGAAGAYVYDRRQTTRIDDLRAEVERLRGAVGGARSARESMREVASAQLKITHGQITAVRRQLRGVETRIRKLEESNRGQEPSPVAEDIGEVRQDLAALARKLAELEQRISMPAPDDRGAARRRPVSGAPGPQPGAQPSPDAPQRER